MSKESENGTVINRLRRIEGQIKGLQKMLEEKRSCDEILTQLAACRSALDEVSIHLISGRMKECLEKKSDSGCEEAIKSAFDTFLRYARYVK